MFGELMRRSFGGRSSRLEEFAFQTTTFSLHTDVPRPDDVPRLSEEGSAAEDARPRVAQVSSVCTDADEVALDRVARRLVEEVDA